MQQHFNISNLGDNNPFNIPSKQQKIHPAIVFDGINLLFFPEKSDAINLSDILCDTEETLDRVEASHAESKVMQAEMWMALDSLNGKQDKIDAVLDKAEKVLDTFILSLNQKAEDLSNKQHSLQALTKNGLFSVSNAPNVPNADSAPSQGLC